MGIRDARECEVEFREFGLQGLHQAVDRVAFDG
jgi:hypothetical protein